MDHGHAAPDSCWAIVVAGGSGSRFSGDVPKQYLTLGDRRVLDWALGSMRSWVGDRLVLVVSAARVHDREPLAGVVVAGGATRSDSVRAGLAVLPPDARFVLVHDGARPLVDDRVVADILSALMNGAACVVSGLAVTDTVKRVVMLFDFPQGVYSEIGTQGEGALRLRWSADWTTIVLR